MSGFVRWINFFRVGALALPLAAACGGNGGGSDLDAGDPDSGMSDAAVDAMQPVLMRSGNFAIFENTVVIPTAQNRVGAQVSLSLLDATTTRVEPQFFDQNGDPAESNINGCALTVFDDPDNQTPPADPVDEGAFTVTGTGNGEFECTFGSDPLNPSGPERYTCQSTDNAAQGTAEVGATAQRTQGDLAQYEFPGVDFSNANYVGMLLLVDGFENQAANGAFPIARQGGGTLGNNQLVVVNRNDFGGAEVEVADSPGTYSTLVGEAPLPAAATDPAGGFDSFLDDGAADVHVTGGASSDLLDEINVTVNANGHGLTLDGENSDDLFQIPTDGSPVTFSCTNEGCGETDGGFVEAFVVTMETIPQPGTSFATVQCAFLGFSDGKEVTIPSEVMGPVMDTDPDKIRITVANVAGSIERNEDQTTRMNIFVGHSLTGITDPNAASN